jgi:hypothetical protein
MAFRNLVIIKLLRRGKEMVLEAMQYSAAVLWVIAALLWIRNQVRIKRALTELNREVSKLKESDNDQPGKVLSAEATVNEGAASSLTAEAGRSVRYKSEHDC